MIEMIVKGSKRTLYLICHELPSFEPGTVGSGSVNVTSVLTKYEQTGDVIYNFFLIYSNENLFLLKKKLFFCSKILFSAKLYSGKLDVRAECTKSLCLASWVG